MTVAERFTIGNKFKVPTWPAPNSARIDPAYRWIISTPDCVPRASRYFFTGAPRGVDIGQVGIIDMFPTGPMKMNGQTPINPDGRQVFLECTGFQPPEQGPEGFPGMYVTFLWTRVGFTPTRATYWSPLPQLPFPYHDMGPSQTNFLSPLSNKWDFALEQLGENPDFTADWLINFGWKTISACNLDLPGTPVDTDLMADFNGTDSYISLTENIAGFAQPFVMSAKIRLKNVTTFWPILGRELAGGFFGMDDEDGIFGNLSLPSTWTPVLDTWFDWRWEFEQVTQLKHQLFIDQISVIDVTSNRQFSQFNNLGVYRHGLGGPIWGDFDLRDLKILAGPAGSHTVKIDMPLRVNALDLGPLANHGTPFNMDLPAS